MFRSLFQSAPQGPAVVPLQIGHRGREAGVISALLRPGLGLLGGLPLQIAFFGQRLHFAGVRTLSICFSRLPIRFLTQKVQPSAAAQTDE